MDPTLDPAKGGPTGGRYRFDGIVVDSFAHTLTRAGAPVAVEPKAFAVLLELLRRPGELVGRDQLMDEVWGHRYVTPGVLTRVIAQLRAALDDDSHNPRYIQTRHALGYSFVGVLEEMEVSAPLVLEELQAVTPADVVSESTPAPSDSSLHSPDAASTASQWPWLLGLLAVALALWGWQQRSKHVSPIAEASIAVLPFKSLSSNRDDDYFAEGLAIEMHDALAGVAGLKVAARMSPGTATADDADIRALGRRLGVASVLDASIRREGSRVRISARLSDTSTGYTLWSRSYDRELSDIFSTQSEIADEVVKSLVDVLPAQREALAKRLAPTTSVAAFDAYLRGLQQLFSPGENGAENQAITYFNQALSHDRGFARAQAGICRVEAWRFSNDRNAEAFENARRACLSAERMDPMVGEVSRALGDLYRAEGDLEKAAGYYGQIEHDPALRLSALVGLAKVQAERGDMEGMREYFRKALDSAPESAEIHAEIGYQQYVLGQVQDATASYRKVVELDPGDARYWGTYASLLMLAGNNSAALDAFEKAISIEPADFMLSNMGTLKYQEGAYAEAADLYRRAIEINSGDFMVWGFLGDALLADPATRASSLEVYAEAARRAEKYLEIKSDDPRALAAMGWYQANLGQAMKARELLSRSEAYGETGVDIIEVALYNAQTLAALGDVEGARRHVAIARSAGVAEIRVSTNAVLHRMGVIEGDAGSVVSSAPQVEKGQ